MLEWGQERGDVDREGWRKRKEKREKSSGHPTIPLSRRFPGISPQIPRPGREFGWKNHSPFLGGLRTPQGSEFQPRSGPEGAQGAPHLRPSLFGEVLVSRPPPGPGRRIWERNQRDLVCFFFKKNPKPPAAPRVLP